MEFRHQAKFFSSADQTWTTLMKKQTIWLRSNWGSNVFMEFLNYLYDFTGEKRPFQSRQAGIWVLSYPWALWEQGVPSLLLNWPVVWVYPLLSNQIFFQNQMPFNLHLIVSSVTSQNLYPVSVILWILFPQQTWTKCFIGFQALQDSMTPKFTLVINQTVLKIMMHQIVI